MSRSRARAQARRLGVRLIGLMIAALVGVGCAAARCGGNVPAAAEQWLAAIEIATPEDPLVELHRGAQPMTCGFLIESLDHSVQVRGLDLEIWQFDPRESKGLRVRELDEVKTDLASLSDMADLGTPLWRAGVRDGPAETSRVVVLIGGLMQSRALDRSAACEALSQVLGEAGEGEAGAQREFERVHEQLARDALVRLYEAMGETWSIPRPAASSRSEQLELAEQLVEDFHGTAAGTEAAHVARVLKRMVADEQAHAGRPEDRSGASIESLVFQLRDYKGMTWIEGVAAEPGPPYTTLISRGHAAVAELLRALEDDAFTRSVRTSSRGAIRVLRVQDVALAALTEISGRQFARELDTQSTGSSHALAARCIPAVRAWWAETSK